MEVARREQETIFSGKSNVSKNGTRTPRFCTRKILRASCSDAGVKLYYEISGRQERLKGVAQSAKVIEGVLS